MVLILFNTFTTNTYGMHKDFMTKGEFINLIDEDPLVRNDKDNLNSTISGKEANLYLNNILGFNDLRMVSNDLIEKEKLSYEDVKVFTKALEIARMFPESPYALMNKSLKDDFFAYENREYLATATINRGKKSASSFIDVEKNVEDMLSEDLGNILKSKTLVKNSDEWKINELYKMYMDKNSRKESVSKLKPYIDEIKSTKSIDEFIALSEKYKNYFDFEPFIDIDAGSDAKVDASKWAVFVSPSSYRLGSIEYYKDDDKNVNVQNAYVDYICKILKYMGESVNIEKRAKDIFICEKKRSKMDFPQEYYDDINIRYAKCSLADMLEYTKKSHALIISDDLFKLFKKMNIYCPNIEYIKYVDNLYVEENLPLLKDYAILKIYDTFAKVFGEDAILIPKDLNKALYGQIGEDKKIEERALTYVTENMNRAYSRIYVKNHVSKKTKEDVVNMVEKIRDKFCERINNLAWMTLETKNKAMEKLKSIKAYVAYPEEGEVDYEKTCDLKSKEEGGNLIDWTLSKKDLEYRDFIKDLKKSAKQNVWRNLNTYIVNAFYMPCYNAIAVPAGILQAPFYDPNSSIEENLGGIGSVIAHEFTHAFDNNGAKYDKNGTITNWWKDEDFSHFSKMAEDVSSELSKIKFAGKNVNGKLCTGEVIADLGGLSCVLDIAESNSGANLKKVMKAWANIWATRMSKEMAQYLLAVDVHAPSKIRVNFVLSQMDDFYRAFNIRENDGMFVPKENRIIIW